MIDIRPEALRDVDDIRRVHLAAFHPSPSEARLVELLRDNGKAVISLVALAPGQVVGHVLFSPVVLDPAPLTSLRGLGLAPVAVLPAYQNKGIGTHLIEDGLEACRRSGWEVVVVFGAPDYYHRFGFTRAGAFGLGNEYGVDAEFMALELRPNALRGVRGVVRYQPEFEATGS